MVVVLGGLLLLGLLLLFEHGGAGCGTYTPEGACFAVYFFFERFGAAPAEE
jgi:hypothetical protein